MSQTQDRQWQNYAGGDPYAPPPPYSPPKGQVLSQPGNNSTTNAPPAGQGWYPPQGGYSMNAQYPQMAGYGQQQYGYTNVVVTQPYMHQGAQPPPPDHMCAAIVVTLCCFWPTGIIAIMRASEARQAVAQGNMAIAASHARSAKSMINISIIVGIMSCVIAAIFIGVYVGVVLNNFSN